MRAPNCLQQAPGTVHSVHYKFVILHEMTASDDIISDPPRPLTGHRTPGYLPHDPLLAGLLTHEYLAISWGHLLLCHGQQHEISDFSGRDVSCGGVALQCWASLCISQDQVHTIALSSHSSGMRYFVAHHCNGHNRL